MSGQGICGGGKKPMVMKDETCPGDGCSLYPVYKPCSDESCCATEGYSKADGPHQHCYGGRIFIVTPLTAGKTCDDPFIGQNKTPATWLVESVDAHTTAIAAAAGMPSNVTLKALIDACLEEDRCKFTPANFKEHKRVFDWTYATTGLPLGGGTGAGFGATQWVEVIQGSPLETACITITREDAVAMGMPECHNTLLVDVRHGINHNEVENDGKIPVTQAVTKLTGCNTYKRGYDIDNDDEQGSTPGSQSTVVPMTFDADGNIKICQQINYSGASDLMEFSTVRSVVEIRGSSYATCV